MKSFTTHIARLFLVTVLCFFASCDQPVDEFVSFSGALNSDRVYLDYNHADPLWRDEVHGLLYQEHQNNFCIDCHEFRADAPKCISCHQYPHAETWKQKEEHGAAAKANLESCKVCHGADLRGGETTQVSCYGTCHDQGGTLAAHEDKPQWLQDHGWQYLAAPSNCANACHGENLLGGLNGVSCAQCHTRYPHSENMVAEHGAMVLTEQDDFNEESFQSECAMCHGGNFYAHDAKKTPLELTFDEKTALQVNADPQTGVERFPTCYGCHITYPHENVWFDGELYPWTQHNWHIVLNFTWADNSGRTITPPQGSCSMGGSGCHGGARDGGFRPFRESLRETTCSQLCHGGAEDADLDDIVARDNCPSVANYDQGDRDFDGIGDACDEDIDGDGIANSADTFAYCSNPEGNQNKVFQGDVTLANFGQRFEQYCAINGSLIIDQSPDDVVLAKLRSVTGISGDVVMSSNQQLFTINLSTLRKIGGSLIIDGNTGLVAGEGDAASKIYFAMLQEVGGNLRISNNPQLDVIDAALSFMSLTRVGGVLTVENNPVLRKLHFPRLKNVGTGAVGGIRIVDNPSLNENINWNPLEQTDEGDYQYELLNRTSIFYSLESVAGIVNIFRNSPVR